MSTKIRLLGLRPTHDSDGLRVMLAPKYPPDLGVMTCILSEQFFANEDGTGVVPHDGSHLWVGQGQHCLDRDEVRQLVAALTWWLEQGHLPEVWDNWSLWEKS